MTRRVAGKEYEPRGDGPSTRNEMHILIRRPIRERQRRRIALGSPFHPHAIELPPDGEAVPSSAIKGQIKFCWQRNGVG